MKKTIRLMYSLIFLLFITTLVGCKKNKTAGDPYAYRKQKIEYKSEFSNTIFTLECKLKLWGSRDAYAQLFETELSLKELKNKTNGVLYYETENELVFKKDDSFFVVNRISDDHYLLYSDLAWIYSFYYGDYTSFIPFPSFVLPMKNTSLYGRVPLYSGSETVIDSKYNDYIKNYYNELSYDFIEKHNDKVIITRDKYTFTVNFKDNITISIKSDDDIIDEKTTLLYAAKKYINSHTEQSGAPRIKLLSGETSIKEEMSNFNGECYVLIYDEDWMTKYDSSTNIFKSFDYIDAYFTGRSTLDNIEYTSNTIFWNLVRCKKDIIFYIIDFNSIKKDGENIEYFKMHNGVSMKDLDSPMLFHYIDENEYEDMNDKDLLLANGNTEANKWKEVLKKECDYLLGLIR